MPFGGQSTFQYAPGDAQGVGRQKTLYQVQSSWVADAVAKSDAATMAIAAAAAGLVIFLLGRRK